MASNNSNSNERPPITLDGERHLLCLQATWQIEALAKLIIKESDECWSDNPSESTAIKSVATRIKQLNLLLLLGLDDLQVNNARLNKMLDGGV